MDSLGSHGCVYWTFQYSSLGSSECLVTLCFSFRCFGGLMKDIPNVERWLPLSVYFSGFKYYEILFVTSMYGLYCSVACLFYENVWFLDILMEMWIWEYVLDDFVFKPHYLCIQKDVITFGLHECVFVKPIWWDYPWAMKLCFLGPRICDYCYAIIMCFHC